MGETLLIVSYLGAVVAANLFVTAFGQIGLLITGALLIPFDLFSRDILHDKWANKNLKLNMAMLILSGGAISYILNRDSALVAVASSVSFTLAGITDTAIYSLLKAHSRAFKMNASNLCSSLVDSIIFPAIAFGGFSIVLSSSQTVIKFSGGVIWVMIYNKIKSRESDPRP